MKNEELIIKIAIGSENPNEIKTNIMVPLTGKNYWLPTDNIEPLKVRLVDYNNFQGVENVIRVMAVVDIFADYSLACRLKSVSPQLLFNSKNKASEYYLEHRMELDWSYLYEEN